MADWSPHVTVATLVRREDSWLCVEETIPGAGAVINQPAGHWEPGESLVDAAVRETQEETGWRVAPTALVGIYEYQPPGLDYPFLRFAFAAEALTHDADQPLDDGILRALWLSEAELTRCAGRHRSPMVLRCVTDARAGQAFPLEMIRHL